MAERRFFKGDQVKFHYVTRTVQGVVKEDRGPIGINGRHLYLVEFRQTPRSESNREIELPAEDLEPVDEHTAHGS